MAQAAMTIRMDADLKEQFGTLCEKLGMSVNTAFNIYARAAVREQAIPFRIQTEEDRARIIERGKQTIAEIRRHAAETGLSEMTLDEINEEIRLARAGL